MSGRTARYLVVCMAFFAVARRDLAMVEVLLGTGIRVGELVNLDVGHVDLASREMA